MDFVIFGDDAFCVTQHDKKCKKSGYSYKAKGKVLKCSSCTAEFVRLPGNLLSQLRESGWDDLAESGTKRWEKLLFHVQDLVVTAAEAGEGAIEETIREEVGNAALGFREAIMDASQSMMQFGSLDHHQFLQRFLKNFFACPKCAAGDDDDDDDDDDSNYDGDED